MITSSEILMMADMVSREKALEKEIIFEAIEAALATATRKKHELDIEARVVIQRDTGDFETFRQWEIVADDDELEFPDKQIALSEARAEYPDVDVGDIVEDPLEPVEFGRIAAQAAKQVIMQKVREAERQQVVEEYSQRQGEMMSGVVRRIERGDAIVDLGGAEAILLRSHMIPRDSMRPGDRLRAVLEEVRPAPRGPQLFLNRVSPGLLIELFKLEVPEAGEGLIEILSAARDPGVRAKIAVNSKDPKIDPVGACVGIRGSRVQSVSNEIAGERVDIIKWSDDPAQFVIHALAPAEIESIMVDEESHAMDVVMDESQLSTAIGTGGRNVRLASELTGWEINILTDEAAAEKAEREAAELRSRLKDQLDVDEDIANILVQEGFMSVEEVAYVPRQELLDVEEFDEALVEELRSRATDSLLTRAIAQEELAVPEQDLLDVEGMDESTARMLASKGIRDRESLAEYAVDELLEETDIDEERARIFIMSARAPWFEEMAE